MNIDHALRERRLARIRIRAEVARRRSERMRTGQRAGGRSAGSVRTYTPGGSPGSGS
ncbi:hypothetical protein ABN028_23405 [Actinopolymorpha sp. B17G11]|uniref:hypothetical protein n=1 Tax=unclassified Actinopolymorpha TaxID=2627063 RepID=UPI0032D8F4E3